MGLRGVSRGSHLPDRSPLQDPHESDPRLQLHYFNFTDLTDLILIVHQAQSDEIYNLAS